MEMSKRDQEILEQQDNERKLNRVICRIAEWFTERYVNFSASFPSRLPVNLARPVDT